MKIPQPDTKSNCSRLLTSVLIIAGIGLILLALSAGFLQWDPDQRWGLKRVAMLGLGLGLLGLVLAGHIIDAMDKRLLTKNVSRTVNVDSKMPQRSFPAKYQVGAVVLLFFLAESLFVWFTTAGLITKWPPSSDYYAMQADAFMKGQSALLIEPSPELASLSDVYRATASAKRIKKVRHGFDPQMDHLVDNSIHDDKDRIPVILDASYFEGKYYLYFGPVPAIITTLSMLTTGLRFADRTLVFLAVSGILACSFMILWRLRRLYFPDIPYWLFFVGCFLSATAHPLMFILARAGVWEASVVWGQFLLLAGLLIALPILDGTDQRSWRFAFASTLWGLAIGSRLLLIGAVAFLVAAVAWSARPTRESRDGWQSKAISLFALVFPLLVAIGLLGIYNYVRFNNPLETGFQYQLTGVDIQRELKKGTVFNIMYLPTNLAYYSIGMPSFSSTFPFVRPLRNSWVLLANDKLPRIYEVETITGLLAAAPLSILSLYLVASFVCAGNFQKQMTSETSLVEDRSRIIVATLTLASTFAVLPLLGFFTVADRYLLDFSPMLIILAIMGMWRIYQETRVSPVRRTVLKILIIMGLIIGLIISMLLAISGSDSLFDDLNPALFHFLSNLFIP